MTRLVNILYSVILSSFATVPPAMIPPVISSMHMLNGALEVGKYRKL